jgi:hypothetical protein
MLPSPHTRTRTLLPLAALRVSVSGSLHSLFSSLAVVLDACLQCGTSWFAWGRDGSIHFAALAGVAATTASCRLVTRTWRTWTRAFSFAPWQSSQRRGMGVLFICSCSYWASKFCKSIAPTACYHCCLLRFLLCGRHIHLSPAVVACLWVWAAATPPAVDELLTEPALNTASTADAAATGRTRMLALRVDGQRRQAWTWTAVTRGRSTRTFLTCFRARTRFAEPALRFAACFLFLRTDIVPVRAILGMPL